MSGIALRAAGFPQSRSVTSVRVGRMLVYLECQLALTVTIVFSNWRSALTNGALVMGLRGLAFMDGWLEQMSGFTQSARLASVGIATGLIISSESI